MKLLTASAQAKTAKMTVVDASMEYVTGLQVSVSDKYRSMNMPLLTAHQKDQDAWSGSDCPTFCLSLRRGLGRNSMCRKWRMHP